MSSEGKAVFLSYASQDADAARRVAEALRAAGVEVWFDQSELRGGDAWDHKIRQQIKECALFVPIISANTQARPEGYFRLEWRLADQRTHLMGRAKAFLLPVCVDDTKDADADVPDSFLAVQWMRLRNGEADAAFGDRVKRLLTAENAAAPNAPAQTPHATPVRAAPRPSRRWWPAVLAAMLALAAGLWWWWGSRATGGGAVTSPLVAQVWEQLNKPNLARAELDLADGLAKQATEAEPRNADAWAAWSQVDSWFIYHNLDASAVRREGARAKAARAIQLAPASYEARLARACQLVRGQGDRAQSLYAGEAGELLRALLQERRDEPRALLALGILHRNTGDITAACEAFGRLATNPAFAAQAWNEIGWARFFVRDFAAAEAAIDRSIALQPYWGNLTLKTFIAQFWRGDLDRAKEALERIPVSVRQEDLGVSLATELFYWRREPEAMLRVLNDVSRDWLQSNTYDGPKAHYVALAHELAGRREAARLHWQRALDLVQRRLADQPDSSLLQYWKGHLLAYLGKRAEAEDALRLAHEMGPLPDRVFGVGVDRILLGQFDEAVAAIEHVSGGGTMPSTAATLRLNPRYDPIRDQPRFQALCQKLASEPRDAPRATPQPGSANTPAPTASGSATSSPAERVAAVAPDRKSIAVLPFANRSNRDEDAFFTDGIQDDLLTQVSRIKAIKTISRTSVMGYRGTTKNLRQIGEELGVATVLEGGVQRAGDQVRINVQLIDARTDTHLWAERYDRKLTAENVFAIQSEIATAIAAALEAVLTPEEKRQFEQQPTQNLAALEEFFKAKSNDGSAAQTAAAIAHLQRAVALDPDFAEAHALLADQILRQVWTDGRPAAEQVAKAQPHVERALALAPHSSSAYVALGHLRNRQRDTDSAIAAFRHAIELNPNNASAFALLGYVQLWSRRDARAAMESYRKALELDPLSRLIRQQATEALTADGRFDEARAALDRLLREEPDYVEAIRNYGELQESAYYRLDEAIKAYRRAVALDPRNPHFATKLALAHFTLGDVVAARFWLERALAMAPQSRETVFLTGMLKRIEGTEEEALKLFRSVPPETAFYGQAVNLQSRAALDDGRAEAVAAGLATLAPLVGSITQGNISVQSTRACLLLAAGQRGEANELIERILTALPGLSRRGTRGYFASDVLIHLARGDREKALSALREWSDTGACAANFGTGAPFHLLRDDPQFKELMLRNAARLAEQRANLARWDAAGELAAIPPLPDTL